MLGAWLPWCIPNEWLAAHTNLARAERAAGSVWAAPTHRRRVGNTLVRISLLGIEPMGYMKDQFPTSLPSPRSPPLPYPSYPPFFLHTQVHTEDNHSIDLLEELRSVRRADYHAEMLWYLTAKSQSANLLCIACGASTGHD